MDMLCFFNGKIERVCSLTGKLRDRLFEMVLTDDVHHRKQLYEDFLAEIQHK
jgi:hypothetical protein